LAVFRVRELRAGATIQLTDLGEAIGWKRGIVNDNDVRRALGELVDGGYLIEATAALELTPKGETYVYGDVGPGDAAEGRGSSG
jgi:hypothetical protein